MELSSASSSPSTEGETALVGPIIHLIRHAEAEHRPRITPPSPQRKALWEIEDPKLTDDGRSQCNNFPDTIQSHAPFITHIISSPLSRTLDTALRALKSVSAKVDILALPELQTFGGGPNGTGLDIADLRIKYNGDRPADEETDAGDLEGDSQRKVDFRFMQKHWNSIQLKSDGIGNADDSRWRRNYIKGFVRGLSMADALRGGVEIVAVGHGSFFRDLIGESSKVSWPALNRRSFTLDEGGRWVDLSESEIQSIRAEYSVSLLKEED